MNTPNRNALIPRAEQAYRDLADGNYEPVKQQMTLLVRRSLSENKVMGVWSQAIAAAGPLVSLGETVVRPSGASVVVETPLSFESRDFVGRIAYKHRVKVVGMLILPPEDASAAPF